MPNKEIAGALRLLIDPDPGRVKLENLLRDDILYALDLEISVAGETFRSEDQLKTRLETLVEGVTYRDMEINKMGNRFYPKVVVDKENFLSFIRNRNYGKYEGDYTCRIENFFEYESDDTGKELGPYSVLKRVEELTNIDCSHDELTITMRKGPNATDPPARGLNTFNALSDGRQVTRILDHFGILGKITRVTRVTPQRPTLQVKLTEPVMDLLNGDDEAEPLGINTSSSRNGEQTPIWAHLHFLGANRPRKITIEGVDGIVDIKEVLHRLSYHGKVLSDAKPLYWSNAEGDPLCGIPNGDICVDMKLELELNYLVFGHDAFKVTYNNQSLQCSMCFDFSHRAGDCPNRHISRNALKQQYQQQWMKEVGYSRRGLSNKDDIRVYFSNSTETVAPTENKKDQEKSGDEAETEKDQELPLVQANMALGTSRDLEETVDDADPEKDQEGLLAQTDTAPGTAPKPALETPAIILKEFERVYDNGPEWVTPKQKRSKRKIKNNKGDAAGSSPTITSQTSDSDSSAGAEIPPNPVKRKGSPKEKNVKHTGNGDMIPNHTGKLKERFCEELSKLVDQQSTSMDKGYGIVQHERAKREMMLMKDKFYTLFFDDPSGMDPSANENWEECNVVYLQAAAGLDERKPQTSA